MEDIFKDGTHANNRYPPFGHYHSPIPYVITSPPHQPISKSDRRADDVSDDDDDDDDDDVISLSTIPEVPSVMAGTLSPSEYLELGSAAGNRYRRRRAMDQSDRRSRLSQTAESSVIDVNNVGNRAFYANQLSSEEHSNVDKTVASRRRRLTMLLTSVVVIFLVIFIAIIIVVVIILGELLSLHQHPAVYHRGIILFYCCPSGCVFVSV